MSPLPIADESSISAMSAMSTVSGVATNNTFGITSKTASGTKRRDTYVVKATSNVGEHHLLTDDDESNDGSSGRRQLTNDNDVEAAASLDIASIDAIKEPLELPSERDRDALNDFVRGDEASHVHEPNQATSKFLAQY